jgi:hypothetical protein
MHTRRHSRPGGWHARTLSYDQMESGPHRNDISQSKSSKKTRGFRLVTKILKAPAESAGPADSKSALIILLTSPEVAYRGGYF